MVMLIITVVLVPVICCKVTAITYGNILCYLCSHKMIYVEVYPSTAAAKLLYIVAD
jgi:hypothetical protein